MTAGHDRPVAAEAPSFSDAQVADYQAARDILARQIRQLLIAAHEATDEDERRPIDEAVQELSRRRGALSVGSPEVDELLAQDAKGSSSPAARVAKDPLESLGSA